MKHLALLLLGMTLALFVARSEPANPFPWVMPWDDAASSFTDMSSRLQVPAGERGFLTVRDGHLADDGGRVRLFGVNLCFGACFPTHEEADRIAARMAKLGINIVRFHHMDTFAAPEGLLKADGKSFDLEMVDRLDYFIAALKKRGIYTNLNLHVGRLYPGMPTWTGMPQYFKGIDQFYAPMIAMQKEFAHTLLAHVNKYTGVAYREEPAIGLIEINNENSLLDQWWKGALDTLPEPYGSAFNEQWREWRAKHQEAFRGAERESLSGEQLLRRGHETGNGGLWASETHGDAEAALAVAPRGDGWRANVAKKGAEAWHVQVNSTPMTLRKGEPYTFTFEIMADTERQITVAFTQAAPPWNVLWSTQVAAGPERRAHTVVMSPGADVLKARIGFINIGEEPGSVEVSSTFLQAGAPAIERGEGIMRKVDFAAYPIAEQQAWIRFLWETESGYWQEMRDFLRETVRTQALLVGTQVGFSPVGIQAAFDVIDAHGYWQHPVFPKQEWDLEHWSVNNIPMAGVEGGGALAPMAAMRVVGKPFICTEYSHPAPNAYGSEAFPLLAAYAAMQDWDGVFAFAYSHRRDDWDARRLTGFFDIDQDPSRLVTIPAALNLFVRGDVAPARERRDASVSTARMQEETRSAGPNLSTENFGLARDEFLRHATGLAIGDAPSAGRAAPDSLLGDGAASDEVKKIASDHGELTWETAPEGKPGVVVINTPRTKGVIGQGAERSFPLGDITVTPGRSLHGGSVILATEMDPGSGFWLWRTPRRFLISATGACENVGMGWKNSSRISVGKDWGDAPTQLEGIYASIAFKGKGSVKAWALDERGHRREELPVRNSILHLSPEHTTLWYEVEWGY